MLENIIRKTVLYGSVGGLLIAFVLFYGGPGSRTGHVGYVAKVGGEEIPLEVFRVIRRTQQEQEERLRAMGMKGKEAQEIMDDQTIEYLIQRSLLSQRAAQVGFRVSDEELREETCANPYVKDPQGRCTSQAVDRWRQQQGFESTRTYLDMLRREILVRKMLDFYDQAIRVSDTSAREELRREKTSVVLDFVAVRAGDASSDVKVTPEEAAKFGKDNPERVNESYQLRISEFKRPEQVKVSHILFTGDKAAEEADAAVKKLAGGQDFAALAKELSKDPATQPLGGDLGYVSKDQMLPEFATAAFAAELNKVTGPVKTERGLHVLRVEEKRPAVDVSLEQATPQVASDLLTGDRASEAAHKKADALFATVTAGKTLADAAKEQGLKVEQTPKFTYRERQVPGMDPLPGLRDAALALRTDHPNGPRVFGDRDVFYLIALSTRAEPTDEEITAELPQARERIQNEMRSQLTNQLYMNLRKEAEERGEIATYGLDGSA